MDNSSANGPSVRGVDGASKSAHQAIDNATGAVGPMVDRLAAGAHQTVDRMADAAQGAAHTLDSKGVQLHDVQARVSASVRQYVHDKPLTSLGIAVASGFLLNWVLRHR